MSTFLTNLALLVAAAVATVALLNCLGHLNRRAGELSERGQGLVLLLLLIASFVALAAIITWGGK